MNEEFNQFLITAGAVARVNDAGREHGQIRAFSNSTYDVTKVVPTLVMRNEDYGRIARLLADKIDVQIEINIVNTVYPAGHDAVQRHRRDSRAPTRRRRSSCSAAISTRGTRRPAPPTTPSAAR